MKTRRPIARILYNGTDITKDVSNALIQLSYVDNVEGKSDELRLVLDDPFLLWRNEWYPQKGDQLRAIFGYQNLEVNAGAFEIDEIEISGAPAKIEIRAIAAGTARPLRTKTSFAHEDKTLREIAQTVAEKNGLTVFGNIAPIRIGRATQNRETDLHFLNRLAREYGYFFSVRDTQLTFTSLFEADEREAVKSIDVTEISGFSLTDKLVGTYAKAEAAYHNVESKETVKTTATDETQADTASDTLQIRDKAENRTQADQKAKTALYRANTEGQTGRISLEGNPVLLAGNTVNLTGLGQLTGKYRIESSAHDLTPDGYTTSLSVRRIGLIEGGKKPKAEEVSATSVNTTRA